MRKSLRIFIITMLLLLAYGVVAVVYGVKTYNDQPLIPTRYRIVWDIV